MADLGRIVTKSSLSFKLALIALFVTLLIHIIGYSTDNWMYVGNVSGAFKYGLWKFCLCVKSFFKDETCVCSTIPAGSGEFNYAQSGESISEPRHDKTNKMSVRPAKTQISPGIRSV